MLKRLGNAGERTLSHLPKPPEPPPILKRRCYNVSRASSKILLNKMLQRSNVATSWKRRQQNVITLPLETPPPKHTVCESNNSPAPRGAPPPKTCVDSDTRNTTKQCNDDGLEGSHGRKETTLCKAQSGWQCMTTKAKRYIATCGALHLLETDKRAKCVKIAQASIVSQRTLDTQPLQHRRCAKLYK